MGYSIIDASGLMHMARHSTGDLSTDTQGTGIIFGFLSQIYSIKKAYPNNQILLCYDSKSSKRRDIFPEYKRKRVEERTPEEKQDLEWAYEQFTEIRRVVMPRLGFANAYLQPGLEADDLIAKLCQQIPKDIVIVSRDHDLYQLLRPGVVMYNTSKKTEYTYEDFLDEWGIDASRWWEVKVLAGCSTDEVPGIAGIGEKTAIKYFNGELTKGKKLEAIEGRFHVVMKQNKPLVRLPFEGTQPMTIHEHLPFKLSKFLEVCSSYAFEYFIGRSDLWKKVFIAGI